MKSAGMGRPYACENLSKHVSFQYTATERWTCGVTTYHTRPGSSSRVTRSKLCGLTFTIVPPVVFSS